MYTTMAERHRYREVLLETAGAVLLIYAVIMVSGYWFFAQFTLSPGMLCVTAIIYLSRSSTF